MIHFHHMGFVVESISHWEKSMLFESKVKEIFDKRQNALLSLYNNFGTGYIELIQPFNKSAYTWNALEKYGNHFHHLCYEADNRTFLDEIVFNYKMIPVLGPIPALLFDNKQVMFFFNRNKQIVEFLINEI